MNFHALWNCALLALSLPLLIVCHPVLAFLHRKFTL